jgi:hypothetical protein
MEDSTMWILPTKYSKIVNLKKYFTNERRKVSSS